MYNKAKCVRGVNMNSEIIMYQTDDALTKLETTFDGDTVWLLLAKWQNYSSKISLLSHDR